jgi:hypothetical protein
VKLADQKVNLSFLPNETDVHKETSSLSKSGKTGGLQSNINSYSELTPYIRNAFPPFKAVFPQQKIKLGKLAIFWSLFYFNQLLI